MVNNIPTFIISHSKESEFLNHIYGTEQFIKNANVIVLHEIRVFKLLYDFFDKDFQFRLMLHPSLKGNSEFKKDDFTYLESQLNTLKENKEFEKVEVPFITRALYVKKLCKEQNKNFIAHDGYIFFDATRMDMDGFEKDIPVFTKVNAKNGNALVQRNDYGLNCLIEKIDYAILTALYYEELEEIRKVFALTNKDKYVFGNNAGFKFEFAGKKILAVSQHQMGMVDSAILSTEIMMKFNPEYIIMPGVCGGDRKTKFGDVVISTKVHLFQAGKLTNNGFLKESAESKIDEITIQKIQHTEKEIVEEISKEINKQINKLKVKEEHKFFIFQENKITTHVAPTACSTMVIDKKGYFEQFIKSISRKMIAVEMEGFGMARATESILNPTKSIMIKCVMDNTKAKKDIAKAYAAYVSAHFVKKMIEKKILE